MVAFATSVADGLRVVTGYLSEPARITGLGPAIETPKQRRLRLALH